MPSGILNKKYLLALLLIPALFWSTWASAGKGGFRDPKATVWLLDQDPKQCLNKFLYNKLTISDEEEEADLKFAEENPDSPPKKRYSDPYVLSHDGAEVSGTLVGGKAMSWKKIFVKPDHYLVRFSTFNKGLSGEALTLKADLKGCVPQSVTVSCQFQGIRELLVSLPVDGKGLCTSDVVTGAGRKSTHKCPMAEEYCDRVKEFYETP